jgi:hypothetical protein
MLRTLTMMMLIAFSAPAFAIYKCEEDGKITYSETKCPDGKGEDLSKKISNKPQPYDPNKVKQEIDLQKQRLQKIENERKSREASASASASAPQGDDAAAKKKKCDDLAKREAPSDDTSRPAANVPKNDPNRDDRRAEIEKLEAECR